MTTAVFPARAVVRAAAAVAGACALALGAMTLGSCSAPVPADPESSAPAPSNRERLAALAATAKDQRYVATYLMRTPGQPDRDVTVAIAMDYSWVVAVPGGALSGLVDIAIYFDGDGLFQCTLGPAAGSAGVRPDLWPIVPGCVPVASLDETIDPRVQHVFTDWIDPLIDRTTALSVAATAPLAGAEGSCFSVESNSAALAPPVDPGVYCYRLEGILSAAEVSFGTLLLAGRVDPARPTVDPPAPRVDRDPVPVIAPPAPDAPEA